MKTSTILFTIAGGLMVVALYTPARCIFGAYTPAPEQIGSSFAFGSIAVIICFGGMVTKLDNKN